MAHRLLIATRKGLFQIIRDDGSWRIAGVSFLGDPVTAVLSDPRDGQFYAALNLGRFGVKLHRSQDAARAGRNARRPPTPRCRTSRTRRAPA